MTRERPRTFRDRDRSGCRWPETRPEPRYTRSALRGVSGHRHGALAHARDRDQSRFARVVDVTVDKMRRNAEEMTLGDSLALRAVRTELDLDGSFEHVSEKVAGAVMVPRSDGAGRETSQTYVSPGHVEDRLTTYGTAGLCLFFRGPHDLNAVGHAPRYLRVILASRLGLAAPQRLRILRPAYPRRAASLTPH